MERKTTIQDIADRTQVSKSTVSRYLNHGYVSAGKMEIIRKVIEETGFQSNFFAKRLKTKQSKLIGIILPRMDSVTVGKLLVGINHVLEPAGYQGIILVSDLKKNKEIANISSLQQQGIDGIIIDSVGITRRHLQLAKTMTIPMVFTGQRHKDVNYVKIDDMQAGRMMGAFMRQMGHRRVVFAGVTEHDKAVGVERKQGFINAFIEGTPEAEVIFVETGFDFESAYLKGSDMLEAGPTAIICATDNIGLGVLRYLHERRIEVPEQVSVAGFGGYAVGAVSYPALTTVAFDYELVGMKTAQGLLDLLAGRKMESKCDMPLFFVERESVRSLQV
jgi:LacI family transcriptional regulator, sucrose operon repressor